MELPLDQLISLFNGTGGNSGFIQSILLVMIWINVRSLKNALIKLEEGHELRITKNEKRISELETKVERLFNERVNA